jgi:hypothetical protein
MKKFKSFKIITHIYDVTEMIINFLNADLIAFTHGRTGS